MRRYGPSEARPERNYPAGDGSARDGVARRPELVIRIPLEEAGRIVLAADTAEDELRLRLWLRRSRQLEYLPACLERLLDDLDELDREAA